MGKDNWFEIDSTGFALNQGYREPWTFIRELIANSFDEQVTKCEVTVESAAEKSQGKQKGIWITVEDNGPGFENAKDIWTLYGPTRKRKNPNVRGRFNSGEKEFISVATEATVETVGKTVIFDDHGRRQKSSDRTQGTKVSARLLWNKAEIPQIVSMLRKFIPPEGVEYYVTVGYEGRRESEIVSRPSLVVTVAEFLPTVLEEDESGLRRTTRKSDIAIYESRCETGWLYELGIPIQPLDCPFHVSVEQKVPLDPNRSTVSVSYLKRIYAIVLNETHSDLRGDQLSETWVSEAVQSDLSSQPSRQYVVENKYRKTLLRSSDSWANEEALEAGYDLIDSRLIPPKERERLAEVGLVTAGQVFGTGVGGGFGSGAAVEEIQRADWTDGMEATERLAIWMASEVGIKPTVQFINAISATVLADYNAEFHRLRYNVSRLGGPSFFNLPLSSEVIRLTLHEISHESGDGHDVEYRQRMEELSAKLMLRIAGDPEGFREVVGELDGIALSSKRIQRLG